jgi:archaellum biogenesis ATPase FlaH
MSEMYEWAQKYRAIGWSIIPLYNHSKNPAPIQWKEYQQRLATDEEFEKWFTDPAVTGMALVTGKISGVVVLDEDVYKPGGIKVSIKTGMLAKTARDGRHHYFRYVEPIKSSGFRKGINVEIKADGGIVVLPPSQVNINDELAQYEWLEKCHPDDLLTITEEQLAPYRAESNRVNVAELSGSQEGNRHNNLRSMALSSFNRFRKEEWGFAENIIKYEASQFNPPHPAVDVERIIKDAKEFVRLHPKKEIEKEIENEWVAPRSLNELAKQRVENRKLEAVAPSTGWPELDNLIKGFVPGHLYTFTGDTNVGKTTIACNWAEAVRKQQKRTLYIALEPDVDVIEYLASVRLKKRFDEVTDDELFLEDEYVRVLLQDDISKVQDLIRVLENIKERYDLIIIDHIGYFVQSERDWIQQQANILKQLKHLGKKHMSAVVCIAHLRKPSNAKKNQNWVPTQDDISGSAAFKQDSTEVMIAYRPTKPADQFSITFSDEGYLLVTKTKTGPNGSFPLIFAEKSAKVWSELEALTTEEGKAFLTKREEQKYMADMRSSAPWMQEEEVDTGNDD